MACKIEIISELAGLEEISDALLQFRKRLGDRLHVEFKAGRAIPKVHELMILWGNLKELWNEADFLCDLLSLGKEAETSIDRKVLDRMEALNDASMISKRRFLN